MTDTSTSSPASILKPVVAGIVRHGITAVGGGLLAAGYITQSQDNELITDGGGLVMLAIGIGWSWWQKHSAAKAVVITMMAFGLAGGLTACSTSQIAAANAAAPAVVQAAVTADPSLAPKIALACAATVSTADLAVAVKPTSQPAQTAAQLAHSACDTPTAQAQLAANDVATVQPDGGSLNWLAALATAAKIAATVAPLL